MGNVTRVDDPGGTITYTYFGNGNLKTSSHGGATQIIEQDGWGRKTKLTDPSAGVYTYAYNGFNEIVEESSPEGITKYRYSDTGRITSRAIEGDLTEIVTYYDYDSSTKLLNRMFVLDEYNELFYDYNYEYDHHNRVNSIIEIVDDTKFSTTLNYDSFSRIEKETYTAEINGFSSSSSTQYNYDTHGAFIGFDQWKIKQANARGQITIIELGTGEIESMEYDAYGYLKKNTVYEPETIGNHIENIYSFNPVRGTLSSRSHKTSVNGYAATYAESFQYDTLDRLTSIEGPFAKKNVYDNSGRITENSQIGDIAYQGGSKRYQLKDITLNKSGENYYNKRKRQEISYNAEKKPVEIHEENQGRVTFLYGLNGNRTQAWYGGLDTDKNNRKYHKRYSSIMPAEIIHNKDDDSYKFMFYKGGDAYSAPMVDIEKFTNGNSDGGSAYHLQRDYLGSILNITEEVHSGGQTFGVLQERRQFGAWGTVDAFWSRDGDTKMNHESIIDRGYTGHEHFFEVGLIHMNGRMYDPKLERFLSPDNYIQNPYNTQNYNRYSYVLNNPLMYNDPTGQMYGDESGGSGTGLLGGALIGGALASIGASWDSIGAKDFFNNEFTKPFREIGRWVRGWFEGGSESPIVKMSQPSVNIDPLVTSNPQISSIFTSGGAVGQFASSAGDGFSNFYGGLRDGVVGVLSDPIGAYTDYYQSEGYKNFIPGYVAYNATIGNVINSFGTAYDVGSNLVGGNYSAAGNSYGNFLGGLSLEAGTTGAGSIPFSRIAGSLGRIGASLSKSNSSASDLIRVRHHTSRSGLKGIKQRGEIIASRGRPYGVDVEIAPFLKPSRVNLGQAGRGAYIEFSIPRGELYQIPGFLGGQGNAARIITEGLPLNISGLSPRFVRWYWLEF